MIQNLFRKSLELFRRKTPQENKFRCSVCESQVAQFDRLPDCYFEELDKYGYIHSIFAGETFNFLSYSCPCCGASDRDRLYALFLKERFNSSQQGDSIRFLDIAPSAALKEFVKKFSQVKYRTADIVMNGVDDLVDVMDMNIYESRSFDAILCSHVLEHVDDDQQALKELYRVLKPQGWGIVMVPVILTLEHDYEDPSITTPADRWKHYGQDDHVRIYSKKGFISKLESVGFKVSQLDIDYFGEEAFVLHGLNKRSVLYTVLKQVSE